LLTTVGADLRKLSSSVKSFFICSLVQELPSTYSSSTAIIAMIENFLSVKETPTIFDRERARPALLYQYQQNAYT
jgi:hypothetical protein